jgi:hypothetical protein
VQFEFNGNSYRYQRRGGFNDCDSEKVKVKVVELGIDGAGMIKTIDVVV